MRQAKTNKLIEIAAAILAEHKRMTVRQIFYHLVSRQVLENNRSAHQAVSKALVAARLEGMIPWEHIADRLRRPRHVSMCDGLFAGTAAASYRRDVWTDQPTYIETWLEKDALSGIFEDVLDPYGVTLNVGRGFDGWDSTNKAALRFRSQRKPVVVLYFGDFDPSGEDMVRSLRDCLAALGSEPEMHECDDLVVLQFIHVSILCCNSFMYQFSCLQFIYVYDLASSPAVSGDSSEILVPRESRTKTRFTAIKQAVNHSEHGRCCESHSLLVDGHIDGHRPAPAQHVQKHKHVQIISWACT